MIEPEADGLAADDNAALRQQVLNISRAQHDPQADARDAKIQHGLNLTEAPSKSTYDGILLAVPHEAFRSLQADQIRANGKPVHVFFDMKNIFSISDSDLRL